MNNGYELLDSGLCQKIERFGPYSIVRPALQAVWKQELPHTVWEAADASFDRCSGERWRFSKKVPQEWQITIDQIRFLIRPTEFGHLGIFAEQRPLWDLIQKNIKEAHRPVRILNLFAYSGGSTLAAALAGAEVCHLDAAKGMVDWARKNAALNNLQNAPIRWIVDDAVKFLKREIKRGRTYDGIILDPPSFGRGANGEVFKIEEHIIELLSLCNNLMSDRPLFVLFSCHTAGFTQQTLQYLLEDTFPKGSIESGELALQGSACRSIPSGVWTCLHWPRSS